MSLPNWHLCTSRQPGFFSFASFFACLRSGFARDSGLGTTRNGAPVICPRVDVFDCGAFAAGDGAFGDTNCTNTSLSLTMPIS